MTVWITSMSTSKKQKCPCERESWKTEDKALAERVRVMTLPQVKSLLNKYRSVSLADSIGAGATAADYYNRLMVCLLDGRIPAESVSK